MSSRKLFSIFSNSYTITFSSFDHTIPVPLRRLSINLLKHEPSQKSLKMKRYLAAMDNNFLLQVLAASSRE
jgi:hypothetical protein